MFTKIIENNRHKKYFKMANEVIERTNQYKGFMQKELADAAMEIKKNHSMYDEDEIRINAFSLAYEAAKRTLKMEAYPVQLYGAKVLTEGNIAEMRTGEGKTLVSLFGIVYEVLCGKCVHVITANEYLAARDEKEIGKALQYLGISVGINKSGLMPFQKKEVYKNDVVYGTSSEFGFDYLRDNMVRNLHEKVQRSLDFVLIDEADSILIDEARTPLIISGAKSEDLSLYLKAKMLVARMVEEDYEISLENNQIWLTDKGIEKAQLFWQVENIYEKQGAEYLRVTLAMIRSYFLMHKDKDYVVTGGKVEIIDSNTGRVMIGRRFSDGIHQCLEAKENVKVNDETMTLATITIQNYFRMYGKIAGMTGTAKTEEEELQKIYGLDVIVVPTNLPIQRIDHTDEVYINQRAKMEAILKTIKEVTASERPMLIGTASIQENELLSAFLHKNGIKHEALSAKNHEREAEIISQAGQLGAVTLATNMAGRGTDIKITDEVKQKGGLYVLGTAKHDSRRIDNQLRGRAGRQGDPGEAKFILSLDDDLIKKFNGLKIQELAKKLNYPEDEPIGHKIITDSILKAQKRIEGSSFDARKNLIEYDEVIDGQRKFIYGERDKVLKMTNTEDFTTNMIEQFVEKKLLELEQVENYNQVQEWVIDNLTGAVEQRVLDLPRQQFLDEVLAIVKENYLEKSNGVQREVLNHLEKDMFLQVLDKTYIDHIDTLVRLKEGIHLRSYAQTNPLIEYKNEAARLFDRALEEISEQYSQMALNYEVNVTEMEGGEVVGTN